MDIFSFLVTGIVCGFLGLLYLSYRIGDYFGSVIVFFIAAVGFYELPDALGGVSYISLLVQACLGAGVGAGLSLVALTIGGVRGN